MSATVGGSLTGGAAGRRQLQRKRGLTSPRFPACSVAMRKESEPQSLTASWNAARTFVLLAFVGVAVVALIVGPAKFFLSFAFCLVAFSILVTFISGSSSAVPVLPGWLLAVSYVVPILWIGSLWFTGVRAWDRNNIRAGIAF